MIEWLGKADYFRILPLGDKYGHEVSNAMNETNLKQVIAKNISYYRRQCGWTQLELAEKINYSDKSVSKWERAEGLPDIVVLTTLAELFGVTVNDLLREDEPQAAPAPVKQKRSMSLQKKINILLLSAGLVWFVAALVFFMFRIIAPSLPNAWFAFVAALPVCAIVVLVFCCMWWGWLVRCISVSALVWLLALSFNIMLNLENSVLIYVVAAVFQVLIILWYFLMTRPGDKEEEPEEATE